MDFLIIGAIGALVGGFHGVGVAVVGYACFLFVLALFS